MFNDQSGSHTYVYARPRHRFLATDRTQVWLGKLSRLDWRTDWFFETTIGF